MTQLNILIVDDDAFVRKTFKHFLKDQHQLFTSHNRETALDILNNEDIHVIFLDIQLKNDNGLDLLREFKASFPEVEIIMISAHTSFENAREALRNNASDFIGKPMNSVDILRALERTRQYLALKNKLEAQKRLNKQYSRDNSAFPLIFISKQMKDVVEMAKKVAETDKTSVLITGESGTGKEMLATGIHGASSRSEQPFVPVNCSSIPRDLFESEFFGYKKGAFTGAINSQKGWFEAANGGTLFLDEIADLDYDLQKKLLRVLEDRHINRLGDNKRIKVDFRVIAATNRNIDDMVMQDTFRIDLYHRLNIFRLHIPPLRERKDDLPVLIDHFANMLAKDFKKKLEGIDKQVYDLLASYSFPGNARELKNLIERALIMMNDNGLKKEHFAALQSSVQNLKMQENTQPHTFNLNQMEKDVIQAALQKTNGNKSRTAKLLNISWQSLDRRLKKFGL